MSKIEVNTIEPQCGTTLTLGASGDTVTLATGASQSGFGRTGTVDWQTSSIKTTTFTAANGEGYFCNTTSGSFTVNLPAGSAGAIVSVQDYNNTFDSNALTVTPNGSEKINGGAGGIILNTEGEGLTLVYIDSTVGWRSIQDNVFADQGSNFLTATGGTITESGDFKIHTFTGPGTFTVNSLSPTPANNEVSYIVVAGGGGGGGEGGGAGAGGFRERKSGVDTYTASPLNGATPITVTATAFPITVGGGGPAATSCSAPGTNGSSSTFSSVTSAGGGFGGSKNAPGSGKNGGPGGSGGGAGRDRPGPVGAGNTPPVSPSQGFPGGDSQAPSGSAGGGGGGATAAGAQGTGPSPTEAGGDGGAGATTNINGSPTAFAGGGGGGSINCNPTFSGCGGAGGGGRGGFNDAVAGTANTGGGGGASGQSPGVGAAAGGSGIVIIRYKFQ